jgi:hypothetical protein
MFVDDDDVVLNPTFDSNKLGIMHHGVVTHRLLEVLTLIQEPTIDLNNKNFEYQEWKIGCVGNVFNLKEYYKFLCDAEDWFPTLNELYGSKRIMAPDDYMLHHLWVIWLSNVYGDARSLHENIDRYSYSLTYLEDRAGRYNVDKNTYDCRYAFDMNGLVYIDFSEKMCFSFDKHIKEKLNIQSNDTSNWYNIIFGN